MWEPIETAPKDGSAILLLSAAYEDELGQHPAKVAIGYWDAGGTSWVDELGRLGGAAYKLAETGIWISGGGWFQPNEVTHWMPLPTPDAHWRPPRKGRIEWMKWKIRHQAKQIAALAAKLKEHAKR